MVLEALRRDRASAVRAELHAQLHVHQAQEGMDLGQRRHRALASAAAGALLDRHRGRDAEHAVDVGPAGRLHELARVGVERFQIAALALAEDDVEGQRGLARARQPVTTVKRSRGMSQADVLQVVLARVA
jgi:hypothetical protein